MTPLAVAGKPPRVFHTVDEVADILKMSDRYVYNLIWQGKLRATKHGRSLRVPDFCLDEYIDKTLSA